MLNTTPTLTQDAAAAEAPEASADAALEIYRVARKKALRNEQPFLVSSKEITVPSRCPLLNVRLKQPNGRVTNNPTLICVIPEIGWIPSNVVVVSGKAAKILQQFTIHELTTLGKNLDKRIKKQWAKYETGHL